MGGRRGPRLREPERDGVLRGELPADEGPRVRDEARTLVRRQGRGPGRPSHPRTEVGTTVHYCTSGYKDGWQLRSRIKRRAGTGARPPGLITEGRGPPKGNCE